MTGAADLLDLVRRGPAALARDVRGLGDAWRAAEQSILAQMQADPRAARPLVETYGLLAAASGETEPRGRAERLHGSYLALLGRNDEAARRLRRAARLLDGAGRDQARLGLAAACARLGRRREATRICADVRRAAARRGDAMIVAFAEFSAALLLHEAGRPQDAVAPYRRAMEAFAAAGRTVQAATAAQNLANALVLLDRHEEALALYGEAARGFDEAGAAHEAARLRYNRGALLVAMDRLGEAEKELAAVERDVAKAGDPVLASLARLDRGEALLRAGLAAEAARLLDSAARGIAGGAPAVEVERAALLRARAAVLRGRHAAARRILRRKISVAARPDAAELVGLAFAGERRFADARRALDRAAKGFGASRPVARTRAVAAAGWCAFDAGDVAAARRAAVAAEKAASRLGVPSAAFAAASLRFSAEDAAGRRAPADAALERSLAALEKMREGLGADPMRAAVLRGRERWFARAVRHVLAGPRGARRALDLVERWRSRALVELLQSRPSEESEGRTAMLRAKVALLERRLEDAPLPTFLRSPTRAPAPDLARRLATAERRLHEAVVGELRAGRDGGTSVDALRAMLPPKTVLVSLLADSDGGLAFVVGRDRVRAVPLPLDERALRSHVEELHFRVGKFALGAQYVAKHGRRLAAETDRVLEALARGALAPIDDDLGDAARIVIAPHDAWRQVPFAALPFRGGRFVDAAAVASTPSFAALTTAAPAARGRPLVLAVADASAPTISDEGRAVAAAAGDAVLLEGESATIAALRAARRPRFVHIASHGRFRGELPGLSGVRLADGWLTALDFHSLDLAGSTVVLSGCETGVSDAAPGAELSGLVRGVLSSGAVEVVVSLWRVDDAATARLMARFHALRAASPDAETALAGAQREAAAEGLHPWYWAGFAAWTRRAR